MTVAISLLVAVNLILFAIVRIVGGKVPLWVYLYSPLVGFMIFIFWLDYWMKSKGINNFLDREL